MARPSFGKRNPQCFCAALLKFFEILARQIKTIGMIDPETRDCASAHQLKNQPVNSVENLWQFNPDRCQIVNVKKAAIINLFGCDAPNASR